MAVLGVGALVEVERHPRQRVSLTEVPNLLELLLADKHKVRKGAICRRERAGREKGQERRRRLGRGECEREFGED